MTITAINPVHINEFIPLPGPVPGPGGIVPPWLEGIEDPGWGLELYDPTNPGLNPVDPDTPVIMNDGVVPPWLR